MCETGACQQREDLNSDELFTSRLFPTALTAPNLRKEITKSAKSFFSFLQTRGHWRAHARMQTDHATHHLPVTSSPLVAGFSSAGRCMFIRVERLVSQGLGFRFAICWRRPQALTMGGAGGRLTDVRKASPTLPRGNAGATCSIPHHLLLWQKKREKMDIRVDKPAPWELKLQAEECVCV